MVTKVVNREPILRVLGVLNRHEPFISYIQIILHKPNSYKIHGNKECFKIRIGINLSIDIDFLKHRL